MKLYINYPKKKKEEKNKIVDFNLVSLVFGFKKRRNKNLKNSLIINAGRDLEGMVAAVGKRPRPADCEGGSGCISKDVGDFVALVRVSSDGHHPVRVKAIEHKWRTI